MASEEMLGMFAREPPAVARRARRVKTLALCLVGLAGALVVLLRDDLFFEFEDLLPAALATDRELLLRSSRSYV